MTFYLKYRPQKISELDLKDIREQFSRIFSSADIPHAFLFSGPRGLGKTSAARIVAKIINCTNRKTGEVEPCNKCRICRSISRGTCLDLIEIDAASNRGIDNIRELRENVKLIPNEAAKKVYIIDEVHMLTPEAFNALLKTLEEPPEHVIFILCTTEAYKLPQTIISRCHHFKFSLADLEELVRSLKRIKKREKLVIEEQALKQIARRAEGSFRDATKTLERLVFLFGKRISLKKVNQFFSQKAGSSSELLALLAKKQTNQALDWIKKAVKEGVELKVLTQGILEGLRSLLLAKYQVLKKEAKSELSIEELKSLVYLFDRAGRQLKGAIIPQLPLEMAIIEWGEQVKQGSQPVLAAPVNASGGSSSTEPLAGDALRKWQRVRELIKQDNFNIEALLKSTRLKGLKGDKIMVEVFYEFHKKKLESAGIMEVVRKRIVDVFKKELKLEYILSIK